VTIFKFQSQSNALPSVSSFRHANLILISQTHQLEMSCEAETVANLAVNDDPRYEQGLKCLSEKNFEDAIELFSSLLQSW
jgi:outer membrane protein assembly factor BamD (BamD/ComL family)